MAEYIEREALRQELVVEMVKCIRMSEETKITMAERVLNRILEAPAADVVEIVRCRDCKFWNNGKYGANCEHPTSGLFVTPRDGMGFCSYGEKRRNDADN